MSISERFDNLEIENERVTLTKVLTEEIPDILASGETVVLPKELTLTTKDIEEKLKSFRYTGMGLVKDKKVEDTQFPKFTEVFYEMVYHRGNIPTCDEFVDEYISRNFQKDGYTNYDGELIIYIGNKEERFSKKGVEARLLRTYPSLVRDLHFCLLLRESGLFDTVHYSIKKDYKDAVDILVTHKGREYTLALSANTQRAKYYKEKKKTRHNTIPEKIISFELEFSKARKVGDFYLYGKRELEALKSKTDETQEV